VQKYQQTSTIANNSASLRQDTPQVYGKTLRKFIADMPFFCTINAESSSAQWF